MSISITTTRTNPQVDDAIDPPEQLSLLSQTQVSSRFRLSHQTRVRGLQHVAEIRARLAARADTSERRPVDAHQSSRAA